jgi:hypothetical protein
MKRKLCICIFAAVTAGLGFAEDTNGPAAAGSGQDESLAARRARIENWRLEYEGRPVSTNASYATNMPAGPSLITTTNDPPIEERRARVRAKLLEWQKERENFVLTNGDTNLPLPKLPSIDNH